MRIWSMTVLAVLLSFRFVYMFLNFSFQAPTLSILTSPLHPNPQIQLLAWSPSPVFPETLLALCHTETELRNHSLTVPRPQACVLGLLFHFWFIEMFIWFLNLTLSFRFLILHFICHCYALWTNEAILNRIL